MFRVHQDDEAREELALDLDEIARQGARRMLAQALEAEVDAYIVPTSKRPAINATREATPWSFAMGALGSARSSVGLGPWRSVPRGSTTAGSTSMESVGASRA